MRCVRLVVGPTEVDDASGRLWLHDPVAVHESDGPDGVTVLVAGFDDLATAAMVAAALPPDWAPTVESVADDGPWRHAWRAHAEAVHVGDIVVWPDWLDGAPPAAGTIVRLDPGTAFGSGDHPSTRLTLAALQRLVRPGDRVIDVGCGSGVLSVAAALLGAGAVVALDIDPEAITATNANAALNGVRVEADCRSIETDDGAFDVVLANIGAAVLTDLAPLLAAATRGSAVLAGLLMDQAPAAIAAYAARGMAVVEVDELDGWAAVVLRPASA